jgi:hypothetical protein
MSLNKRLTCYHEAGHAIRAYFLRKQSLVAAVTTLQPGEGGSWNGQVGVNLEVIPEKSHMDIALAGLMAEALRSGIEHAATGGVAYLPDEQSDLAELLVSYYDLERTPEDHHTLEHTLVRIERANGDPVQVVAAISFNDDEHWFRIGLLADDLNEKDWPRHYDYISFLQTTMLTA